MAFRTFLRLPRINFQPVLSNTSLSSCRELENLKVGFAKRYQHIEKSKSRPIKFTTSEANVDYRATHNFYHDDPNLPRSHNYVLAFTGISGVFYLIFLRDDIDQDGGLALLKPVHETIPEFAIPMLQAAIVENRKFGYDTTKLEKKLSEYMQEPDKYGGEAHKLVEN